PANTSFDAANSTSGWSCAGATCTLPIGNLAVGAASTAIFAVTVANVVPAGTTQMANSASISDGATRASANDTTPVVTAPGLPLSKSDGGASVLPGGTVIYTLSYANTGNVGLSGVVLQETVPANTSFNPAASSGGWSCAGASCTLNVGTLAGGAA